MNILEKINLSFQLIFEFINYLKLFENSNQEELAKQIFIDAKTQLNKSV